MEKPGTHCSAVSTYAKGQAGPRGGCDHERCRSGLILSRRGSRVWAKGRLHRDARRGPARRRGESFLHALPFEGLVGTDLREEIPERGSDFGPRKNFCGVAASTIWAGVHEDSRGARRGFAKKPSRAHTIMVMPFIGEIRSLGRPRHSLIHLGVGGPDGRVGRRGMILAGMARGRGREDGTRWPAGRPREFGGLLVGLFPPGMQDGVRRRFRAIF